MASYYVIARHHAYFSSLSPTLGSAGPRFLVYGFGVPLLWTVFFGAILLQFDKRHCDLRDRVAAALDSRPVANLVLLGGRLAATVATASTAIVTTAILAQAWGILARHYQWGVGDVVEPVSLLIFIVLDAVPALLVWCSFVLLLHAALRNRLLVALVGAATLVFLHWALLNTPNILSGVSLIAYFGRLPSDLLPWSFEWSTLAQRGLILVTAAGVLVVAGGCYPRTDSGRVRGIRLSSLGGIVALAGVGGVGACAARAMDGAAARDHAEAFHRQFVECPRAQLEWISGHVQIEPGRLLALDLELSLLAPSTSNRVVFSFNPGLRIRFLAVDGEAMRFTHQSGLLTIDLPHEMVVEQPFSLSIRADGIPDPGFGYLDSAIAADATSWIGGRLRLLGTDISIFDEHFVALMPGGRWLPMPGPGLDDASTHRTRDYFGVDLTIKVPSHWKVAGTGGVRHLDSSGTMRFRPKAPVSEVAIIAAEFVRYADHIDDVQLEILVSKKHDENIRWFAPARAEILRRLDWLLAEAKHLGIPYLYGGVTAVEVPARLRTYAGGWRMDTLRSLPGVVLLREHGLTTARFDGRYRGARQPSASRRASDLRAYVDSQGGGDVLASASRNLFGFLTGPSGPEAMALELVLDDLVAQLLYLRGGWFSTHDYRSETGSIPIPTIPRWISFTLGNRLGVVNPAAWEDQPSTWNDVFRTPLANLPFDEDPQAASRVLALRSFLAARAIVDVLGQEGAAAMVGELRNRFVGRTFNYSDFDSLLGDRNALRVIIRQWLEGIAFPAFRTSHVEVSRLGDGDRIPAFHGRAHVLNDGPGYGLVRIVWGTARNGSDFLTWHAGDPVIISPSSAAEVAFVSQDSPADVWLLTYLSRNRQDMRLSLRRVDTTDRAEEDRLVGSRPSEWRPVDSEAIIVDDLDPAFSVEGTTKHSLLARAIGWLFPQSKAIESDRGLRASRMTVGMDSLVDRVTAGAWSRQEFAAAWGKYRRTIVHTTGDSGGSAVFSAVLPKTGCWRLEYHVPDLTPRPRFSTIYRSLRPVGVWAGGDQETYNLVLSAHDLHREIEFDATAASGWREVGVFDLVAGDYRLGVSSETSGESVIADAIRWVRVGHDIPNTGCAVTQEFRGEQR